MLHSSVSSRRSLRTTQISHKNSGGKKDEEVEDATARFVISKQALWIGQAVGFSYTVSRGLSDLGSSYAVNLSPVSREVKKGPPVHSAGAARTVCVVLQNVN